MDDFDSLIEKYRRELMDFSKNNPAPFESVEAFENIEDTLPASHENIITKDESTDNDEVLAASAPITAEPAADILNPAPVTETQAENADTEQNSIYIAPQFADYNDFLKNNPQSGSLKVQVSAANQAFPIPNARVTVVLELKNGPREMYDGLTDINGIIDNIKLPAPDASMSQAPSDSGVLPYSTYTTYIEHPDFVNEKFTNVPVFPGIKSIQGVELISRVNYGNQPQSIVQNEDEPFTRLKGVE